MTSDRPRLLALASLLAMVAAGAAFGAASPRRWVLPQSLSPREFIAARGPNAYVLTGRAQANDGYSLTRYTPAADPQLLAVWNERPYSFAVSADGAQALLAYRDGTGISTAALSLGQDTANVSGRFANEWARGRAWTSEGTAWLSTSDGRLVLHHRGASIRLQSVPNAPVVGRGGHVRAKVLYAWPAARDGAAYALVSDGRLYECTGQQARLLLTLPTSVQPWRSDAAGRTLFVLADNTIFHVNLTTHAVERRDLRRFGRELGLAPDVQTVYSLRVIHGDVVAIAVSPAPKDKTVYDSNQRYAAFARAHPGGIYLLRFSRVSLKPVLTLGGGRDLAANGDGLAFDATKQGVWAAVMDYPQGSVTNSLLYMPLPAI